MSQNPSQVTKSRIEIEQDGYIGYLEFETDDTGWLTLWHTEVPPELRGRGIATQLVQTAFEFAKDKNLRVDVICPVAVAYVTNHPEYQALVGKKR